MGKLETLEQGLIEELKDLYSAEKQLLKALPKMEKKASNEKLKEAFGSHLEETQIQLERLDEIATLMDIKLSGKTCKAMQGLIEEGKELLDKESENEAVIDALLIGSAQRVEHYEIAAYGTSVAMAKELGLKEVVDLLQTTLDEEGEADKKLTSISQREVLPEAIFHSSDSEESESTLRTNVKSLSKKSKSSGVSLRALMVTGLVVVGTAATDLRAENTAATHTADKTDARGSLEYETDNTGRNVRDRNGNQLTADSQTQNSSDIEVLANIRREVVAIDELSVNGKNVKIMVEKNVVMLRGPVNSIKEKQLIDDAAKRAAPGLTVVNKLEVSTD